MSEAEKVAVFTTALVACLALWSSFMAAARARAALDASRELAGLFKSRVSRLETRFDQMWTLAARQQILGMSMIPRNLLTPSQAANYDRLRELIQQVDLNCGRLDALETDRQVDVS